MVLHKDTPKYLGGGSVTRFAKVMKDGPDTKELRAEKELKKNGRLCNAWEKKIQMMVSFMMILNTKN